jgi:hypothetical protein
MKRWIVPSLAALVIVCHAAPARAQAACYVRVEAATEAASAPQPTQTQSHIGMRRKTDKLFDLDIAVVGPGDALCTVGGVARVSGEKGREALAMVVRPDPLSKTARTGTLCQVFVHLTPTAVELRTTPSACKAQSLCDGRVELNGQRFEQAARLPAGTNGPCFERRAR